MSLRRATTLSETGEADRRPSQRDVAARAGVSRTTVSLVLNDRADATIPEATQRRVWEAAEALGFRPNAYARGLRGVQTHVIGLLTDDIATTPYAVQIVKGAQDAAFAAGRQLMIIDTHGQAAAADEALAMMASWRVDAVVYATDFHRTVDPPERLASFPSVLVDCFAEDAAIPAIVPDEQQGGRLATETLIEAGHRRIGIITGPSGLPASAGRLAGYQEALAAAGIAAADELVEVGDWWQESGYAATKRLLALDDPPSAIFCCNDWMAMGAYDALRELGRAIPDDVAVIGFDDRREIAEHMRPRLTTVALPYYEMGHRGVRLALEPDNTAGETRIHVECPLIERGSV